MMENIEENEHTLHLLNKVKLKPLVTYLWTDLEKILVDMPCDFKTDNKKKYRNGFLVITYGAVYIFKNKFLVSPPPTFILTLLDCQTVSCNEKTSTISLSYDDFVVKIRVKESVKITNVMAKIVAECTYGLEQYVILPKFQIKKNKNKNLDEITGNNKTKNDRKHKSKNQNESNNSPLNQTQRKVKNEVSSSSEYSMDKKQNKAKNEVNSANNSPLSQKQNKAKNEVSSSSENSMDKKQNKAKNEVNSANNSPLNQKQSKVKNETNSPKSDYSQSGSPLSQKQNDDDYDDDENQSNLKLQKISTQENALKPNTKTNSPIIQHSRSEGSFFYFNTEQNDDLIEIIDLTKIVQTRPKEALFKRCLFLAHFYNIYGLHLGEGCQYMTKYDEDPTDTLTIGPHFKPSKYSLSYGHAIGWETNITKVLFYHYKPMHFGELLESILINSINIRQICFVEYKYSDKTLDEIIYEINKHQHKKMQKSRKKSKEEYFDEEESSNNNNDDDDDNDNRKQNVINDYIDHFTYKSKKIHSKSKYAIYIPDFSLDKVKSTNVTSFLFHECDYPVIASFFEQLKDYLCPIDEFEISSCKLSLNQISQILKDISNFICFNQLKAIAFLKNSIKAFPFEPFQQFINITCNLESIDISESEINGSQLFAALCTSHSPVKSVRLSNLKFEALNSMSTLTIPPTLIHADFSKSSFSPQSFKDLLILFTNKKTNEIMKNCNKVSCEMANLDSSVMLCMSNINLEKEGYEVFNSLNFSSFSDNICEFDWSGNMIPPNCVNSFFKFLETQKKMRILILNIIKLEKQSYFFRRLLKYIMKQKLPGLDMRSKLYKKQGISFYESLKKATFIRKLGVVIRNGSDEVMKKFNELIQVLPMLTELTADGFLPHKKESLIELWTSINEHPTICASDFPQVDILYLEKKHGIKLDDQHDKDFLNMLKNLKEVRKKPSSMQQRTDFVLTQIRARNENIENNQSTVATESDFFVASCSTPWIDSTPHSRLENIENECNIKEQEKKHQFFDNSNSDEEKDDSALLLNISDNNNQGETYDMKCLADDPKSSEIAPSIMPDYDHDENNKIDKVEKVDDDDDFDDQSIDVDESESDNENDDDDSG